MVKPALSSYKIDSMNRPVATSLLVLITAVLGSATIASGQPTQAQQRLAAAKRLDCRFQLRSTASWDERAATATVVPTEFAAAFSNIDIAQGTAQADGRAGSSYIVVRHFPNYLHLLQMIDIGPVYLTTVLAQEAADGRLLAIHTRHEYARSSYPEFREWPEIYLGDCAVGE